MEDKNKMKEELNDFAKLISGEMALRKKEEQFETLRVKAIKEAEDTRRKKIVKGEEVLKTEEIGKKVVQNIKLFEWEAPERFDFKINKKVFLITVILSLLFILLLAILGNYFLMFALIALLFFIYVAGTTKPQITTHKVTERGIDTYNRLYEWFMLSDFFFSKKGDQFFLIINTKLNIPKALVLLLEPKDVKPLFVLLQDKLVYKDIRKQTWFDKVSLGSYISLEEL